GLLILQMMQRAFPEADYDERDLQIALMHFMNAGLLLTDGTVAQSIYHQRQLAIKKAKKGKLWLTILSKFISFKITLFDPDLLLLRMSKRLGFLWTWKAVAVLLVMMASSGWLLTRDTGSFTSRMPNIFGWENLFIIWIVMILVKIVHEFGHGLACKHFGGEVHEMGAMFILFSPFLFCNATDSWVFTEKWKRIVVNFGGIYLELFLASVAAALWVLTPPGLFNQVCFNVALVCSVMTVFFNVNPLMKFDGYYALSDFLEVPNLKERADRALVTRTAGFFTGGEGVLHDPIVEGFKWPILIYGVGSYVWTFLVASRMLHSIGIMLEPIGLDRIAQSGAAIVLLMGIVAPPWLVGSQIMKVLKSEDDHRVRNRVVIALGCVLLVVAALLFLPAPVTVKTACALEGGNRIRVTAATSGFIKKVSADDGQSVKAGEELAVLENPELEAYLAKLRLQKETLNVQQSFALSRQMDKEIPSLRAQVSQVDTAIAKQAQDVAALQMTAPQPGIVIGQKLREKVGSLLRQGELLCEILPEGRLQAVAVLKEDETSLVEVGQSVTFRLLSSPGKASSGQVLSVASSPSPELPHQSLSEYAGGTVPSVLTAKGGDPTPIALPTGLVYKAIIALDDPNGILRPGMSGLVKIQCGHKPLGAVLYLKFRNMLRSDFQI
ncbi:MAG: HlyD family efflux transporter periplasmic adaptor subunit, partial [Spartobacteria bacterium]|nr:HlyD family efflux transporter periplasmic adaptor subunit [Spartobacteria bacterium]